MQNLINLIHQLNLTSLAKIVFILLIFVVILSGIYLLSLLNTKFPVTFKKVLVFLFIAGVFLYQIFGVQNYLTYDKSGQNIIVTLQDFLTLLLSIVIEAFPFIMLGVGISTLVGIGFFEWIVKIIYRYKTILFPLYYFLLLCGFIDSKLSRFRVYQHVKISFMGIFLPVCECGNIPVARRLVMNGFSPSQAITFLLSAPILNPITFYTTYQAFQFTDPSMVWIRMIGGFFIANFIGILLSFKKDQNELLTKEFYEIVCDHDHEHEHEFEGKTWKTRAMYKINQAYDIFQNEFIDIMKVLSIGAVLAAASQIFLPRSFVLSIGTDPVFSIIAMILFAFIISVCSNVDAFIAQSFANTFSIGSLAAFLVFGPMIDIKILTMMKKSFTTKTLIIITTLVTLISLLVGLIVNFVK